MDPLSITTAVITCLQAAGAILSFCYDVRTEMHSAPWTLIQVIEEVRDLRNVIEALQSVLDRNQSSLGPAEQALPQSPEGVRDSVMPSLATCLAELQFLEQKIKPQHVSSLLESRRKALISAVTWRLKGSDAKESVARLQRCKASLNLAMSAHNWVRIRNLERLAISLNCKLDTCLDSLESATTLAQLNGKQRAVANWLSPLRPGQAHHAALKMYQPGTCEWFLDGSDFKYWLDGKYRLLWLTGPPGSGKTTMMSRTIELIAGYLANTDKTAVYAVVYCDFRNNDSKTCVNLLGSILVQLCTQLKHFPDELLKVYHRSSERSQGNRPTIEIISKTITTISEKRRVFIFVDAVDEMEDPQSLVLSLVNLTSYATSISVLAASRNEARIQALEYMQCVSIDYHIREVDEDIRRYVVHRLSNDPELSWLSSDLQSVALQTILSKSRGMFRWAQCQLDSISQCRTIRAVRRALETLPYGLNDTYGRILASVAPSDTFLVRKALCWLSFSAVPFTLTHLWEALAIEVGCECIDEECRLRSPQDILTLGNNLITVAADGRVILAHLSVRDYLLCPDINENQSTARFALQPGTSHRELAQDCLTYLGFSDLSSGPTSSLERYVARLEKYPLLRYATRHWFYHFRNAESNDDLRNQAMRFFSPKARQTFMSWVQVLNADVILKWNVFPRHATSIYYAASLGLDDVVESLLLSATATKELNAPGSRFGGTPLHVAALRKHVNIVKRLIAAGADCGKGDFDQVTPLHSAASRGSMEGIRLLLEHGAPRDVRDSIVGMTPADWARERGWWDAANLIEHGLGGITAPEND